MKLTFALLSSAFVASAIVSKPNAAVKPAAKPALVSEEVKLTKNLDSVVSGLENILASQTKGPDGPTKFSQILKPFLVSLHAVLNDVKTNKKLSEEQKLDKLRNAQASIKGLTKDMSKRSDELKAQDSSEKESLLIGVLMSRKGHTDAQLEVMKSQEFENLAVVKYVLAHRDEKKDLTEQVAAYLDQKTSGHTATASKKEAAQSFEAVKQEIVEQLQGQLKKMEDHVSEQSELHKKVETEQKSIEKKLNDQKSKLSHLKGTEKKQKAVEHALKLAKRMAKKEEVEYNREHSVMTHDAENLKNAIDSVKKGDMKALESAQQALAHSLQKMKSNTGDFLHFLQMNEWTTERTEDCPYCKAQCLEKCHSDGHTFMECMTSCENVGN